MGRRLMCATVVLLMLAAIGGFSATRATAAEEVNVYSSNMQALKSELAASEFQKATGIKANMVYSGSGVALKRMRAEKDNPQGDIFLGGEQSGPHVQRGPAGAL